MKLIKITIFIIFCIVALFIGMFVKEMNNRDLKFTDLNKEVINEMTEDTVQGVKDKVEAATDKVEETVKEVAEDVKEKIK